LIDPELLSCTPNLDRCHPNASRLQAAVSAGIRSTAELSSTKEHPLFNFTINRNGRRTVSRGRPGAGPAPRCVRPRIEPLESRLVLSSSPTPYLQTNLVSDIPGLAQLTDSSLVNPWGVSFSSTSPFWVSNQGTNTSTLYSVTPTGITKVPLTVNIPATASGPQGPTGQVSNNTSSLVLNSMPAHFIFANLNGTISA
jgi:hypothetical protein